MLPLRFTQMKSMMKQTRLKPQIDAIRAKYKKYPMSDPRRRGENQEIMALYKTQGVNPAGGCLPLLIQWPFLVAFYSMLGVAIELRHAPWLWIKDLSAPDPYYILPILTIIGMMVMQKMTPQAGMDPMQQKMMTFTMPLVFGFISYSLAAGLVLYWVASNGVQIAQQWTLNRTAFGREMRETMAKRAQKSRDK
jgi:YidC/Oxa1 family membrane protein insertase